MSRRASSSERRPPKKAKDCGDRWQSNSASCYWDTLNCIWRRVHPSSLGTSTPLLRITDPTTDPPRCNTSSDTSTEELSPTLLGAIQRIVSTTIREKLAVLTPTRTTTPSDVDVPKKVAEEGAPVHVLPVAERQGPLLVASQEVPP
ncbi:UNVERIFIED_CONTAM: hypothetical protein Slati_0772200 [Sesamum latifolium]|uniref:Uncharacterized protein n=1 Tax=Sesamum latifolium TaxID=2727402 RepID=A0AAW2XJZ4_9LAMI